MALTKKAQATEPSLVPTLEGGYDCIWFEKKGTNVKPHITRINNEAEAIAFVEKKHVEQVLHKISGWYAQQVFIRYHVTETDYMNIKPRLETLGRAIDKLRKVAKDRKELCHLLDNHVIEMIEVCKPSKKSKFSKSTELLIGELKTYCEQILSKQ